MDFIEGVLAPVEKLIAIQAFSRPHTNSDLKFIEKEKKNAQSIFDVAIKSPSTIEYLEISSETMQISSETNKKKLGQKNQFKCNTCQFETSRYALLNKHKKSVHEGIKLYKCNNCDYETADNWKLKNHKKAVHERIKPYKCNYCEHETAEKGNLDKHIKSVHEGIKPFKCNMCKFETAQKWNLNKHIEFFHEGIKPFKCNICEYETLIKTHLKWHVESVHDGFKPFKCDICDYETRDLKKHINSAHKEIKPFKCHICQYKSATKFSLKRHITYVHEKMNNEKKKPLEIYETSLGISNGVVVSNMKKNKSCVESQISFCQNCNQIFVKKDHNYNGHSCLAIKQETQEKMEFVSDELPNYLKVSFQSIKVEPSTLKQLKMSDSEDPLHIGTTIVKNELFEGNENQNPNQTSKYYVENMQSNQIEKIVNPCSEVKNHLKSKPVENLSEMSAVNNAQFQIKEERIDLDDLILPSSPQESMNIVKEEIMETFEG